MRVPLHFLIPSSSCVDEPHMDQICLCSTIWWPLLWFRKPSRRWMGEKKFNPYPCFCSLPVIPLWSSGWCLNPVSFLLSDGLGDFITRTQTTNRRILRLFCFIICTVPPKTIILCYIWMKDLCWPLRYIIRKVTPFCFPNMWLLSFVLICGTKRKLVQTLKGCKAFWISLDVLFLKY